MPRCLHRFFVSIAIATIICSFVSVTTFSGNARAPISSFFRFLHSFRRAGNIFLFVVVFRLIPRTFLPS